MLSARREWANHSGDFCGLWLACSIYSVAALANPGGASAWGEITTAGAGVRAGWLVCAHPRLATGDGLISLCSL